MDAAAFQRPYVVSWNLTYRCNLACEHCYLDAGAFPLVKEQDAFADRRELGRQILLYFAFEAIKTLFVIDLRAFFSLFSDCKRLQWSFCTRVQR